MGTKDYGIPMRIPAEQVESLDVVAKALTKVRDDFYKERGAPAPEKPMGRKDALRESIWLGHEVSTGTMLTVSIEDLKDGEFMTGFLNGGSPLAEFILRHTLLTALAYLRQYGHQIEFRHDGAGRLDIQVDGAAVNMAAIEGRAQDIMAEASPKVN